MSRRCLVLLLALLAVASAADTPFLQEVSHRAVFSNVDPSIPVSTVWERYPPQCVVLTFAAEGTLAAEPLPCCPFHGEDLPL